MSTEIQTATGQTLTMEDLRNAPKFECPVTEYQPPGAYCRQIFMPAGMLVVGHVHRTEHINVVISGRARVLMGGVVHDIKGPMNFISKAGVRKVLWIIEDMIWMTVHPTKETDIAKITAQIIDADASCEVDVSEMELLLKGSDLGYSEFLRRHKLDDSKVHALMDSLPAPVPNEVVDGSFRLMDSMINGKGMFAAREIDCGEDFPVCTPECRYNLARYVNHSDYPNAVLYFDKGCGFMRTIKTLMEGEEVTMDYNQNIMRSQEEGGK